VTARRPAIIERHTPLLARRLMGYNRIYDCKALVFEQTRFRACDFSKNITGRHIADMVLLATVARGWVAAKNL
jgi:hypothetical protein